jgi:hypothetical protein
MDDSVEHAVFQQKLASLEALRKLLPNGLFYDPGPSKSD